MMFARLRKFVNSVIHRIEMTLRQQDVEIERLEEEIRQQEQELRRLQTTKAPTSREAETEPT